jgi:hypothetical protein
VLKTTDGGTTWLENTTVPYRSPLMALWSGAAKVRSYYCHYYIHFYVYSCNSR